MLPFAALSAQVQRDFLTPCATRAKTPSELSKLLERWGKSKGKGCDSQCKFVPGEKCRVDKRSASTLPARKGGCAYPPYCFLIAQDSKESVVVGCGEARTASFGTRAMRFLRHHILPSGNRTLVGQRPDIQHGILHTMHFGFGWAAANELF